MEDFAQRSLCVKKMKEQRTRYREMEIISDSRRFPLEALQEDWRNAIYFKMKLEVYLRL